MARKSFTAGGRTFTPGQIVHVVGSVSGIDWEVVGPMPSLHNRSRNDVQVRNAARPGIGNVLKAGALA